MEEEEGGRKNVTCKSRRKRLGKIKEQNKQRVR